MSGEGVGRKYPWRVVKTLLAILFPWGRVSQHLLWNRSQLLKLLQKDPYKAPSHHYWSIVLLHLLQVLSSLHSPDPHNIPHYPEITLAFVISVVKVCCEEQIQHLAAFSPLLGEPLLSQRGALPWAIPLSPSLAILCLLSLGGLLAQNEQALWKKPLYPRGEILANNTPVLFRFRGKGWRRHTTALI